MYLNKALIIGNLTRDPEERQLPSGISVTSFSVATNRFWKDKNGSKQEDTQYHNVVVFGAQAANCAQYLRKGSTVMVEGRMQTRSWDDKDGSKKYRTEIVADKVQFGTRASEGGSSNYAAGKGSEDSGKNAPNDDHIDYPDEDINPEDIPF